MNTLSAHHSPSRFGLTPAGGGSAHKFVGPRVPEELPPLAGAFAVFLFGPRHDGSNQTMKTDVTFSRRLQDDAAQIPRGSRVNHHVGIN